MKQKLIELREDNIFSLQNPTFNNGQTNYLDLQKKKTSSEHITKPQQNTVFSMHMEHYLGQTTEQITKPTLINGHDRNHTKYDVTKQS
jgi:hypothetical protein